jgi:plasmid stability protein
VPIVNLTIRNIPDYVINKIRTLSQIEKRSLNNEILLVLEKGIEEEVHQRFNLKRTINKNSQLDIWKRLSEEWQDDRATSEIIDDIYENRSLGRDINL